MPKPNRPRYLTKSLFVRALSCPTKLAYVGKPDYPDSSVDDDFLEALAEGGIQVGALAQCYFPGGVLVEGLGHEEALAATARALAADRSTVFEAAVRHGTLFIRADILVKDGRRLDLIEVKAKSYDGDDAFVGKSGIKAEWRAYLYDVAFQKHVLQLAFPGHEVHAWLMLADKSTKATVDGLNQLFVVERANGRASVRRAKEIGPGDLGARILVQVDVDAIADSLIRSAGDEDTMNMPFPAFVELLAKSYAGDRLIETPVGAKCKGCEFVATADELAAGRRSGFRDCWKARYGLTDAQLDEPSVFQIWNCRRNDDLIAARQDANRVDGGRNVERFALRTLEVERMHLAAEVGADDDAQMVVFHRDEPERAQDGAAARLDKTFVGINAIWVLRRGDRPRGRERMEQQWLLKFA